MQMPLAFLAVSAFVAFATAYQYDVPYPQQEHTRIRRFQPTGGYSGGNLPSSSNSGRGNQGGWGVDVQHERGGGTRVRGEASRTIESQNGRVRGEIRGHAERTYGGPNDGARSRGVGARVSGSW